jgi:hypothetical protein
VPFGTGLFSPFLPNSLIKVWVSTHNFGFDHLYINSFGLFSNMISLAFIESHTRRLRHVNSGIYRTSQRLLRMTPRPLPHTAPSIEEEGAIGWPAFEYYDRAQTVVKYVSSCLTSLRQIGELPDDFELVFDTLSEPLSPDFPRPDLDRMIQRLFRHIRHLRGLIGFQWAVETGLN